MLVQAGIFEVHVVVPRQAEHARGLTGGDDILQHLVLLRHPPPGPNGVLLIPRALVLDVLGNIRLIKELVHEVFYLHAGLIHAQPESMEIGLQLVIAE